jgi:hypothetical protein
MIVLFGTIVVSSEHSHHKTHRQRFPGASIPMFIDWQSTCPCSLIGKAHTQVHRLTMSMGMMHLGMMHLGMMHLGMMHPGMMHPGMMHLGMMHLGIDAPGN